jgi:disulfide bond formation protein DsbB
MITIEFIEHINWYLAILGIGATGVTLLLILDLLTRRVCVPILEKYGLFISFIVVCAGSVMTLVYSEIFGIEPCGLCWFERVALYAQVIILALAVVMYDRQVARYGIALSLCGLMISLYHHYIQMGGSEFIKCPTGGGDCAKRFLFEFDFITFPLLAAILFLFLITLYVYMLRTQMKEVA